MSDGTAQAQRLPTEPFRPTRQWGAGTIVRCGPIVMNTQEQLRQAFDELERGTFIK